MIIEFNKNNVAKEDMNIELEDILNLFLVFKQKERSLISFDLNVLMMSLAKCKKMERFNSILKNIVIKKNSDGVEIVNLSGLLNKKEKEKLLIVNPKDSNEIIIYGTNEIFRKIESNYDEKVLNKFLEMMNFINNDLEYGIDNWELLFEDEIIKAPNYPSFVSGEFIGQDKNNQSVKKKIKQRAREYIKNSYEN